MRSTQIRLWRVFPILMLGVAGCATVYTAAEFSDRTAEHETVALLPFDVSINLRELPEGLTEEDLRQQERDEAYSFQRQLYTQFLQRYARGQYSVEFQDIDTTNVLLNRADVDYRAIYLSYTRAELADILGVDAIVSGTIGRSRPMGTGAAIATTILFGVGVTNRVDTSMTVHDGEDGFLLWSYDHEIDGGLGSTPEGVAENLMRGVARSFPYDNNE
ncbi:MAG: hypothetical protein OXQ29_28120 [Rhodospirillaceae bacterium]|nr:hypothetical protein [Rhodospirillaceae bacterium]